MKKVTQILCRAISRLLLVCCLFFIAVPASAAQAGHTASAGSYGISITCSYADIDEGDVVDPSIYEKNVFLLSSKDSGLYAIAKYREETQSHQVVDYTSEKDSATPLRCGTDQSFPGELRITGIPEGSYFLTHIETQDEYTLLRNPIEVTLSSGNAAVDGWKQIVSIDPDTGEPFVSISIRFSKDFALPVTCHWCRLRLSVEDGSYIMPHMVIFILLLVLSLITLRKVWTCRPAKLLAAATLVPLLLLMLITVLVATGVFEINHSSGPIIGSIETVFRLIYLALIGTAWAVFVQKSAHNKTDSK